MNLPIRQTVERIPFSVLSVIDHPQYTACILAFFLLILLFFFYKDGVFTCICVSSLVTVCCGLQSKLH